MLLKLDLCGEGVCGQEKIILIIFQDGMNSYEWHKPCETP